MQKNSLAYVAANFAMQISEFFLNLSIYQAYFLLFFWI